MTDLDIRQLLDESTWLRRLAASLVGQDPHRTDDVMQEAWLAFRASPPDLQQSDSHGRLRGWLAQVVRHKAARVHRDRDREQRRQRAAARPESVAPTQQVLLERAELQQRIASAVVALVEPYRSTIVRVYYDARSPADIAAELGIPVATIHTRLHRAYQRLRVRLDDDFGARRTWLLPVLRIAIDAPTAATTSTSSSLLFTAGLGGWVMAKQLGIVIVVGALATGIGYRIAIERRESELAAARARIAEQQTSVSRLESELVRARERSARVREQFAAWSAERAEQLARAAGSRATESPASTATDSEEPRFRYEDFRTDFFSGGGAGIEISAEQIEATLDRVGRGVPYLIAASQLVTGEAALAYLEEALARDPDSPEALAMWLGQVAADGFDDAAWQRLEHFAEVDPANGLANCYMAMALFESGDVGAACGKLAAAANAIRISGYAMAKRPGLETFYRDVGCDRPVATAMSLYGCTLPHLQPIRELERRLAAHLQQIGEHGDDESVARLTGTAAQLADKLSVSGRTLIEELVGIAWQGRLLERERSAREHLGQTSRIAEIDARMSVIDARRKAVRAGVVDIDSLMARLGSDDFQLYLELLQSEGELHATHQLLQMVGESADER